MSEARDAILEEIVMSLEDGSWDVLGETSTPGGTSTRPQEDEAAPETRVAVVQSRCLSDAYEVVFEYGSYQRARTIANLSSPHYHPTHACHLRQFCETALLPSIF